MIPLAAGRSVRRLSRGLILNEDIITPDHWAAVGTSGRL